jgi:peptidase E
MKRQIIAIGGAALPPELDNLLLVEYFLRQTGRKRPRVCFIGAAGGDSESHRLRFYAGFGQFECKPSHLPLFARTPQDLGAFVLDHDAIFVGGGNVRSMLAVWRNWELDRHLRTAWEHGVVLGGVSAGANCWFEHCVTDSIAGPLTQLPCLGWLAGSFCPHYDSEPLRRPTFRRFVSRGVLPDGFAADDGAALHYVGRRLLRAVVSRPRARAYHVRKSGRRAVEKAIPAKLLRAR